MHRTQNIFKHAFGLRCMMFAMIALCCMLDAQITPKEDLSNILSERQMKHWTAVKDADSFEGDTIWHVR